MGRMYSQVCPALIPIDVLLSGSWRISMKVKVTEEEHADRERGRRICWREVNEK